MILTCAVHGASSATWESDTAQVGRLLRTADRHYGHWSLDSTKHYAMQALAAIDALLIDPALSKDRERALLAMKGDCLVLLSGSVEGLDHLDHAEAALRIFTDLGDVRKVATIHKALGDVYHRSGLYPEALGHYRKARIGFEDLDAQLDVAGVLNNMGVSYRLLGELGSAMECHMQALPVMEASGDPARIAWSHIVIGAVFRARGEEQQALEHFMEARTNYERSDDPSGLAGAYNDIGSTYQAAGELDSALVWHERSAALRSANGEYNGVGDSHHYIGSIRRDRGDVDAAMVHFQQAFEAYALVPNPVGMSSVQASMARSEEVRGDLRAALAHLHAARELIEGEAHTAARVDLLVRTAGVHQQAGEPEQARQSLEQAVRLASTVNYFRGLMRGYSALLRYHQQRGDHRAAYLSHRNYLAAKDSVRKRTRADQVTRLSMRHAIEEDMLAERSADELQRSSQKLTLTAQRREKYLYITGGSLFSMLAIGLLGRIRFTMRSRRRMEEQRRTLERAKARAMQGEQFKEQFLANMSHEIRTPMNAIMGMTSILQRSEHLPGQQVQLDAIADNADRLLRILNDILDMSKLEAGRLDLECEQMVLREVVEQVESEFRPRAENKGLSFHLTVDPLLPEQVMGDETRVRQVLANLVDNAIKFTEQGEVRVMVSARSSTAEGVVLRCVVSDTGAGIPADRSEKIFEEFTKVYSDGRHKHGGTGLGLALCKRLVELQGGTLAVASEEGRGSTFTVDLPMGVVEAATVVGPVALPEVELHDLRILLAEDNEFNVMVAQDELQDAIPGVRVDVVVNGVEAVALARTNTYDVILMDVQMPEMNGYDAARAIRELGGARARVPILAMSANVMKADLEKCFEAGMNGHVPKPFSREELTVALKRAITKGRSV